jgi:hypothetical protein
MEFTLKTNNKTASAPVKDTQKQGLNGNKNDIPALASPPPVSNPVKNTLNTPQLPNETSKKHTRTHKKPLKLTLKQELYCQEYIKTGGDRTKAYKASRKTAGSSTTISSETSKLHKKPLITQRINELQALQTQAFNQDFQTKQRESIARYEKIIQQAEKRTKPVKNIVKVKSKERDLFGNYVYEEQETIALLPDPDHNTILKCLEQIDKIKGVLREQKDISFSVGAGEEEMSFMVAISNKKAGVK